VAAPRVGGRHGAIDGVFGVYELPRRSRIAAGVILPVVVALSGCGGGEPQVDSNVPQVKAAATPDIAAGKLPKGMPKNTTANLKVDPGTGRPIQD